MGPRRIGLVRAPAARASPGGRRRRWRAVALAFNALVLPRIGGRRLYRPVDHARGFPLGILLYPLAVLLLILAFPSRLDIAAAAWGILAFGDGAATLVGTALRSRTRRCRGIAEKDDRRHARLHRRAARHRRRRARAGGRAPAVTPCRRWRSRSWRRSSRRVAAAFVETIPVRLDDNISVPATAGGVLWLASLMSRPARVAASRRRARAAAVGARASTRVVAWLGYRARTVSPSGAIGGAIVGVVIYAGGGAARVGAAARSRSSSRRSTSRLGLKRKTLLGIAEERGGRRGAGNAIANCGVAALAAIAAAATPYRARGAARARGRADGRRQRHGRQRDRQGVGTLDVSRHARSARVKPGTSGRDVARRHGRRLLAALALASAAAALGLIPRHADRRDRRRARRPARSSRARSARRSKDRVS